MNSVINQIEADERGLLCVCPECGARNRLVYERLGQAFRCGHCHVEMPLPGEPIVVQSDSSFRALVSLSVMPVLVDFWAPWCGPCKMAEPELARAAAENAERFLVAKVNTEELPGVAQQFRVNAIPTMILIRAGRELARQSGAMPASAIRKFVEQNAVA